VGVKVAIHGDPFPLADGRAQARYRRGHAFQLERIIHGHVPGQESVGRARIVDPPIVEHLDDEGRQVGKASQMLGVDRRGDLPPLG
jgi:hypothetical protein